MSDENTAAYDVQAVAAAIEDKATGGRIACAMARKLAEDLGVPYKAIGTIADSVGVRIKSCDLGCF